MKPSLGRTVIVKGLQSNGSDEHPAVITRVWSDKDTADAPVLVNLTVFPDCGDPKVRGSVKLFDSREAVVVDYPNEVVAFWPDRV